MLRGRILPLQVRFAATRNGSVVVSRTYLQRRDGIDAHEAVLSLTLGVPSVNHPFWFRRRPAALGFAARRAPWSAIALIAAAQQAREPRWPSAASVAGEPLTTASLTLRHVDTSPAATQSAERALVQSMAVCIASNTWSAGELGDSVLFEARRQGDLLQVGYFVYWSAERPWGKNLLTYSVVPALAIDATYSHFLFVMPGVRQFLYGSGDVEGAMVTYRIGADGKLSVESALADDDRHQLVALSQQDLALGSDSIALMTNVWSHQLGAHGAAAYAREHRGELRCYRGESLQPLTPTVSSEFRLGTREAPRRARPAWLSLG